jgi:Starch-binding associating with outer membrane
MKKYLNILMFGLTLSIVGLGCKPLEEYNVNPNEPAVVNPSVLLTSFQRATMMNYSDQWFNGRFGMVYCQQWTQCQYPDESQYFVRPDANKSFWRDFYAGNDTEGGGMIDLNKIIEKATNEPVSAAVFGSPKNQIAVARFLRAWMFQVLTDAYGDIPYSQALKGSENFQPKYDKQRDIYLDLLKEVNESLAMLDDAEVCFTSGDLLYGGDATAWRKFGNSLKMRIGMRMVDVEPVLGKTAVEQAIAGGVFAGNADNCVFNFAASAPNFNPWYQYSYLDGRRDFAGSKGFIDTLSSLSDPRKVIFFDKATNTSTYVGHPYGSIATNPKSVSRPNRANIYKAEGRGVYMDYAEVCFLLAEAAERGFAGAGSAADNYKNGIKASMEYWGAATADADAYVAQPKVDYATVAGTWKQKIGFQKWIALHMQGVQAWTEWRRLDFGVLKLPNAGIFPGALTTRIPLRYTYPFSEQTLNGTNYTAAVASQGPDRLDTPVWWDKQ